MQRLDYRGVDATKAAIFVLLGVFLMVTLIATVLVPDVRKLKVAHMGAERAAIILNQSRAEFRMQESLLHEAQMQNRRILEILGEPLALDALHRQSAGYFSSLDLKAKEPFTQGPFTVIAIEAQAQMSEPGSFYEFVTSVQGGDRVMELDFPIEIKAREDRTLSWRFGLKDYRRTE